MIVFDGVQLHYHYDEFTLLKDVSFLLDGEINTVLCDTQSGKTSLCRLLCGDLQPTGGKILIDEKPLDCIALQDLGILYLPSKPTFFENRSVLYNVAYPLKVRKTGKKERVRVAEKLLLKFGITDAKVKISKLDAETRKLAALARGLTVPRKIVLFDDFLEKNGVLSEDNVFLNFVGATKVIVTSDADEARGKTVVIDGGKTVFQGEPNEAKRAVAKLGWIYYALDNNGAIPFDGNKQ